MGETQPTETKEQSYMALTNALLKSMGIESDQRDQIMAEHQETLREIRDERDELRDKAAQVPGLEKRINDLEAAQPTEDWEAKYNAERDAFAAFKAATEQEKADVQKASLYRSMLAEQGINPKRIDTIMKVTDLSGISVKDGELENADELAAAAAEEWADFIVKTATKGASIETPHGGGGGAKTRDEVLAIEDTAARQAAIAENPELFGLA